MDKAELPKAVLVVGGTGGVGRHVVRILLERRTFQSVKVRVLTRMPERARTLLSGATHCEVGIEGDVGDRLEVVEGDLAQNRGLIEATQGIDAIICASGGSGLGGNSPKQVDYVGLGHLVEAARANEVVSFVLVSSAGITQTMMGLSMNIFAGNYAKWKKKGEEVLRQSGLDYTIVRPTWLTDDDASLDMAEVGQGDTFSVMKTRVNRSMVAEACCASLEHRDIVRNVTFELVGTSSRGSQKQAYHLDWKALFAELRS